MKVFARFGVIVLLLSACHRADEDWATGFVKGWPADRAVAGSKAIESANNAVAWRHESATGPVTMVWVGAAALAADRLEALRKLADSALLPSPEVLAEMQATGLLLGVHDDGRAAWPFFVACARDGETVHCARSAAGTFVVDRLDAHSLHGYFFAAAAGGSATYMARVDATLKDASATAPLVADGTCGDVDEAGTSVTQLMQAAATKDQDTLRRLTVPENLHMWNNFGIINAMQRTARRQPRIISCFRGDASARLWIVPTLADSGTHVPASIELTKRDGKWLFAAIHY